MSVEAGTLAPAASPWLTIWFQPRRTMRHIVDAEAPPRWWPVVALAVLVQSASLLQFDFDGGVNVGASVMPVAIGALQLVFGVLIGPFLLAFIGGWFGGEADPGEIRHAVAWSYMPYSVATLAALPVAFAYSGSLADPASEVPLALLPLLLLPLAGACWSLVTQVVTLAEVQRFSVLRALASLLVLAIPAVLLRLL